MCQLILTNSSFANSLLYRFIIIPVIVNNTSTSWWHNKNTTLFLVKKVNRRFNYLFFDFRSTSGSGASSGSFILLKYIGFDLL